MAEGGVKGGDEWFRGGGQACRLLGFETIIDENAGTFPAAFPMSQIALYAGWYDEHVSGPFTQPTVEFMPGAFAYHLHSFSAATVRSPNHQWVGPLLAKGATATMGAVEEPYLAGNPSMAVFFPRLIFSGFTFGEAAYACQGFLSWQITVVGDPLYRPYGRNPGEMHQEMVREHSKFLEWSYLRLANLE